LAVAIGVGVAVAVGANGDAQTASESETTEPDLVTTEPDPETTDEPAEPGPTSVEEQTMTEETSAEERWLDEIAAVRTEIDDAFLSSDPELTASGSLIELETALRTCSRELGATGPPTARLQPAYILVEQACQAYDKGAECFATAAEIGIPEADTAEDRIFTDALDCGFDAQGSGGEFLVDAEIKGFEISGVHSDEG